MADNIGKMLHKTTYKSHDDKLGKYRSYYDDAVKYGEGFKLLHKGIKNLTKAEKQNETGYHNIGRQFHAAHEKYFALDKVDVLKTYSTILMDMAQTFVEIGTPSGAQHDLTMKTVHTDICDKIDRQTEAVAKLKTSSSVIKKSEQDLEWKRKQVAKAVDNDEKEKRRISEGGGGKGASGGFFNKQKSYNPDEEARHISDLAHEEEKAEKKLREDVERVKTELFEFDANSHGLNTTLVDLVNRLEMFHKQALCKLAELKPKIEENRRIHAPRFKLDKIGDFTTKGERRQVAKPVEILIDKLLQQRCFEEEGLFRLPGAVTKVNIIVRALDSPNYRGDIVDDFAPDNQALASVLKKFYRDLKHPVLQKLKENGDIAHVEQFQTDDEVNERVTLIRDACAKLGRPERYNLAYLTRFCQIIKEEMAQTMMSANALAICWAPTLIGTASTQGEGTLFVQEMIEHAHHVFTDDKYNTLDFDFKKRSAELMEKAALTRKVSNPDEIYGFTASPPQPVFNLQKADISVVHRQEASTVLDKTVRLKKKPQTPPGTMGLIDSAAESPSVQILKHGTPNLSMGRLQSKRVNRPPPPDQKNFTRMPMPSPSANPDYTGFAHMLHSDDEDGSQSGNVDGDNLSLIDEIDAALPGQHSKPEKRPNRKPPKPPAPIQLPDQNANTTQQQQRPTPKPRKPSSVSSNEMTQM